MFSWTYKLSNYLTVAALLLILIALSSIIILTGCENQAHSCESICTECGKCLDAACTEDACLDKCAGHTAPPAHKCESVCGECGKCLDAACTEDACLDKCAGHTAPPAHKCESVCGECGKCLDAACTEDACLDKCAGHTAPPAHKCESVCAECGKCLDAACTEDACLDKCAGHTAPPAHKCESVCAECGKCLDASCTEDACADKCAGHTAPPAHKCESVCAECGKCLDAACTEEACADKCAGHTPHTCESVCADCGKCVDASCADEACVNKCECKDAGIDNPGFIDATMNLNLMSFNIRTMANETNPINNWDSRKDAVVAFVNSCGADIIGMQEVKKQQYEYISSKLNSNYSMLYFPREGGSNPEGLAFVYDNTKFKFVSQEKYWLSETPDEQSKGWGESYYRIAAVLILEHIESGELVKSINTHGPLEDTANVKAYELIMERSVNEGDPFTFLCGDFNAKIDEIGYVPVAEELQDCRATADEAPLRNHITFTGWGSYVDGETPSHIIDFCFVSKGDNVDVKTYQVRTDRWGENGDNMLSDHYPVQVTVEVTYKTQLPEHTGGGFDGEIDPA